MYVQKIRDNIPTMVTTRNRKRTDENVDDKVSCLAFCSKKYTGYPEVPQVR